MSKADPDRIRLVIAGREIIGWNSVTVEMGIDQIADGLSITTPWDPETSPLRDIVRPFGCEKVELYIGDDKLLTGRIDKITPDLQSADRTINLEARALPGILVDASVEPPFTHSGLTLATIARQVCKPFGITVRADADSPKIAEARAEYGKTVAEYLAELAAPHNLLLNSSYSGDLVISTSTILAAKAPVAKLVEGVNETSVNASFDATGRFSKYRIASQFAGCPTIEGEVTDDALTVHRPCLESVGESNQNPKITAARKRAEAFAKSVQVSVTVPGWRRSDGKLWSERIMVSLLAPSAMIYTESPWLVAGVTLSMDASGGRMTSLRLVLPETYSGTMPARFPWAS